MEAFKLLLLIQYFINIKHKQGTYSYIYDMKWYLKSLMGWAKNKDLDNYIIINYKTCICI